MNVAIIGAGLIGRKRALALPKNVQLSHICDIDTERGQRFANEFQCNYEKSWNTIVKNENINAIIVCTTNNWLVPIGIAAINNRKHVLLEKPGARNFKEMQKLVNAQKNKPVVVQVGYNHRYHPALAKSKVLIDSQKYGPVLFIRAKYGHGGRIGYEKEWRFNKTISGGGELLDQGCHLIDLVNFFAGPMDVTASLVKTSFWKTDLEDTAFWLMQNQHNQLATLTSSCVEWKNIFSFEIMLKTAKIQIDGLGGSYGNETLTLYKMKPEMGPPKIKVWTFEGTDNSWQVENKNFFDRIKSKEYSQKSLSDAAYVLNAISQIYAKSGSPSITRRKGN